MLTNGAGDIVSAKCQDSFVASLFVEGCILKSGVYKIIIIPVFSINLHQDSKRVLVNVYSKQSIKLVRVKGNLVSQFALCVKMWAKK